MSGKPIMAKANEEKNKSIQARFISELGKSKLEKNSSRALLFKCVLITAFYLFKTGQTSEQMSASGRFISQTEII